MRGPTIDPCNVYWSFRPAKYVSLFLGLMPLKGRGTSLRFSKGLGSVTAVFLLFISVVAVGAPYYMVIHDAAQNKPANATNATPTNSSTNYIDTSQSIAIIVLNPIIISSMGITAWGTALFKTPKLLPVLLERLFQTDTLLKTSRQLHRQYFRFTLSAFTAFVCTVLAYLFYFSQKGAQAKQALFSVGLMLCDICKAASFCTDMQFSTMCYFVKMRFRQINTSLKVWRQFLKTNRENDTNNRYNDVVSNILLTDNPTLQSLNNIDLKREYICLRPQQRHFIPIKRQRVNNFFKYQRVKPEDVLFSPVRRAEEKDAEFGSLPDALETLRSSHQNLCDVIDGMNSLYGVHILVSISSCFANGLLNFYFSLYGFTSSNGSVGNGVQNVWGGSDQTVGSLALTAYYVGRFLVLTLMASSTINEIHRSPSLLSALNERHLNADSKEELQIFVSHVTSRSPFFSACGFFSLETSLITSALAAWSTYLVIMAQLHDSK